MSLYASPDTQVPQLSKGATVTRAWAQRILNDQDV